MLNYKGCNIPSTYDELKQYVSESRKLTGLLPTIVYAMPDGRILNTHISIEELEKVGSDKDKSGNFAARCCAYIVGLIDIIS